MKRNELILWCFSILAVTACIMHGNGQDLLTVTATVGGWVWAVLKTIFIAWCIAAGAVLGLAVMIILLILLVGWIINQCDKKGWL